MKIYTGIICIVFFISFFSLADVWGASKKTKVKDPDPGEVLQKGREAFYNYHFDEAAELYDEYKRLKVKSKDTLEDNIDIWEKELEIASNAFERVQKVVIVDSIYVNRKNFFDSYKLLPSAGRINDPEKLNEEDFPEGFEAFFINEDGDYLFTSVEDEGGNLILKESRKLLDGRWETFDSLQGDFEKTGDYAYPFLRADGQTLYFANNGEESMGGYDLFVAQKDPFTSEFLQPLNLGMPFNSPYNDFMMAIDEEAGLGWWATDRNNENGDIVIYVYILEDMRKNYPSDSDNLEDLAKISSYQDTWEGVEVEPYLVKIKEIKNNREINKNK